MKILITGASGYLGGRLTNYLSQNKSYKIIATSRTKLIVNPPVQSVLIDWQDEKNISDLCKNKDVIIHLASMNEKDSESDYQTALLNNGMSSLKLIETAENSGVQRFIYMSSIKVFGAHQFGNLDEKTLAQPQSSYGITHKLVEDYLLAKHLGKTIEGVVFRLSNAIGSPCFSSENLWKLICNDFCRQAVTTGEIKLNSTGESWKNFIAISDIEKAFDTILTASKDALVNGLFNLGGVESMRVLDLAKLIAARTELLLGNRVHVKYPRITSSSPLPRLNWKIAKFRILGWKPEKNSIPNEVDNTISYCANKFLGQ